MKFSNSWGSTKFPILIKLFVGTSHEHIKHHQNHLKLRLKSSTLFTIYWNFHQKQTIKLIDTHQTFSRTWETWKSLHLPAIWQNNKRWQNISEQLKTIYRIQATPSSSTKPPVNTLHSFNPQKKKFINLREMKTKRELYKFVAILKIRCIKQSIKYLECNSRNLPFVYCLDRIFDELKFEWGLLGSLSTFPKKFWVF